MHASEFLKKAGEYDSIPVFVLYGSERHLMHAARQALVKSLLGDGDDDDLGETRFNGKDTEIQAVTDELRTVSMWGDRRVVIVETADEFVSNHRAALERYVDSPAQKSVLILDVTKWPKNTILAKKVAQTGLAVECSELKGAALSRWLVASARDKFCKQLSSDAATLIVNLAGNQLGLLNQELAKLAVYVGVNERITPDDVRKLVGGWKAETTWTMINAVRDGKMDVAFECLEKLLIAGEAPQRILGGINFVFRKVAHATEYAREGIALSGALRKAGVFPNDVAASERYLRRIGRPNAERILASLMTADNHMKGGSRISERIQLEQLLVTLSGYANAFG
jgi:DNA polymerase-3 subunit delta